MTWMELIRNDNEDKGYKIKGNVAKGQINKYYLQPILQNKPIYVPMISGFYIY